MQARRHGPISQAKRHGTSKWRLHLGLRRALLRQVGAWVFSLPDQMAYVLAIRVPLLRPSGMVHQTSSSGQEANDQKRHSKSIEQVASYIRRSKYCHEIILTGCLPCGGELLEATQRHFTEQAGHVTSFNTTNMHVCAFSSADLSQKH